MSDWRATLCLVAALSVSCAQAKTATDLPQGSAGPQPVALLPAAEIPPAAPAPVFSLLPIGESEGERSQEPMGQSFPELYRQLNPQVYGTTAPPPPWGDVRRPGEYEPVRDLYLTYFRYLPEMDTLYGDIIAASWEEAHVHVLVDEGEMPTLMALLDSRGIPRVAVEPLTQVPTDSIWIRDYGPAAVFVRDELRVVDLSYYNARALDDAAPTRIGEAQGWGIFRPELVGEWGNVVSNGEGLCLATTFLLEQNHFERAYVEEILRTHVGCTQAIFVPPLTGDTIPHIDLIAQFADFNLVMVGRYDPQQDATNALVLDTIAQTLSETRTLTGELLKVIRVPMPTPHAYAQAREPYRMSYLNLVPLNGRVLVPVFMAERSREAEALGAISKAFPDREIWPIAADIIAPGDGALHCITQTLPQPL